MSPAANCRRRRLEDFSQILCFIRVPVDGQFTIAALSGVCGPVFVCLVLPVCMALVRQQIEDADRVHGEQLQSLGAGLLGRGLLLAWDARFALLTVCIAVFGRAISEVGAVMMVGGNIDGFTRVMTTAIALETSKGDLPLALALGAVLLWVVLCLNACIAVLRRWRIRREGSFAGSSGVISA